MSAMGRFNHVVTEAIEVICERLAEGDCSDEAINKWVEFWAESIFGSVEHGMHAGFNHRVFEGVQERRAN